MLDTILGSKGIMAQTFVKGRRVPVSRITSGPCVVTQIKSEEKDGYWAIQLGFGHKKSKNVTKPVRGHLKGAIKDNKAPKFLAEVRVSKEPEVKVGDMVKVEDIFKTGDYVEVTGISKGKGFAGGVKRWHFAGGSRTHGQSDRERAPGSIGGTTTPGRVYKGKHMAGRMGTDQVTVKNLQVIAVNPETNEIELSGPVPGMTQGLLILKRLSRGKLEGIKEVEAQVIEGEAEEGAEANAEAQPKEEQGGTNEQS